MPTPSTSVAMSRAAKEAMCALVGKRRRPLRRSLSAPAKSPSRSSDLAAYTTFTSGRCPPGCLPAYRAFRSALRRARAAASDSRSSVDDARGGTKETRASGARRDDGADQRTAEEEREEEERDPEPGRDARETGSIRAGNGIRAGEEPGPRADARGAAGADARAANIPAGCRGGASASPSRMRVVSIPPTRTSAQREALERPPRIRSTTGGRRSRARAPVSTRTVSVSRSASPFRRPINFRI